MELNTALQKFKEYERRSFALYHASGLMYYDGDFAAYQQLCSEADSVWHEAKATKCDTTPLFLSQMVHNS